MPRRREEDEEFDDGRRKRSGSDFVDDYAEEDDENYDGRRGRKRHMNSASEFFDIEAAVDSDEEEDEDDGEEDFIDLGADIPGEDDRRIHHRRPLLPCEDDQDNAEAIGRRIVEKYARGLSVEVEYDEEATDVEQQALLPSVRDSKLWMVKCANGHERKVAVCLMQKCIDRRPELQIRSSVALDHLKDYIYIEADKEAHVKEAIKGMRSVFTSKIMLVPIKEMTDVLSVEPKATDISRDTIRMKIGTYKGDLAKIVDVDNMRQRATVKLIPRIDLQALANKLEGREVPKKKAFTPPARFMNIDEARELHIRVEHKRDPATGHYFERIDGMMFKDGFLYKNISLKSLSTQNVQPTFDELEKFSQFGDTGDGDMSGLSTLFVNRKKGHFMKGDKVIVVKGDLRNLKGWVEKVEEGTVHIKTNEKGLPKTLAIGYKELCKYFEPGNHVKVVSGATEGVTGTVVSVEGHVVHLVSDTTKELIRVFADNVMESSEVTSCLTRIGDYELHDLVLLNDNSFGVIIRVESEVLKGNPGRPDVALVRLRERKYKIDKKKSAADQSNHVLSVQDVVRILDGPCRGKQGPIKYIYNGVLFIYDRHHLEHAGFICVKSESCKMVGRSRVNSEGNGNGLTSIFGRKRTSHVPPSPMGRPPRGGYSGQSNCNQRKERAWGGVLCGATVIIRQGDYKGCRGRVKDVKGSRVRIELESQGNYVEVARSHISETPVHPPLHVTPMRDSGRATPYHEGMRTPMHDRAWNPYTQWR